MIKVITLNEVDKWDKIIHEFDEADSYYTPNYVIPYKDNDEGEPILIYYSDGELNMINVVLKRDISLIDNFKNKLESEKYYDLITPYGYGGMITKGNKNNIPKMLEEYNLWCEQNNIVSEFVRFHPLIEQSDDVYNFYNTSTLGSTINVEIFEKDTVWKNYTSNNRNTIRRAKRNNINIEYSNSIDDYNHFKMLYLQTMKGIKAKKYYLFSERFYDSLYKNMKDKMLIFTAIYDSKIIASSLILVEKNNAHYHLSGTDFEYRKLNSTNLLLDEVINVLFKKGVKNLHLGGGLGSEEDSLFKFKRNFNPKSTTNFKVGRKIYNKEKYNELSILSGNKNDDYFPKYRG